MEANEVINHVLEGSAQALGAWAMTKVIETIEQDEEGWKRHNQAIDEGWKRHNAATEGANWKNASISKSLVPNL
ncbi:hypothetical protein SD81_024750 [Tolypothrix campylonemoides VB511288]|nr:hypothetical protein SD81_024750 [Tolypothrix campylonemoides VB511288]